MLGSEPNHVGADAEQAAIWTRGGIGELPLSSPAAAPSTIGRRLRFRQQRRIRWPVCAVGTKGERSSVGSSDLGVLAATLDEERRVSAGPARRGLVSRGGVGARLVAS